MQADYNLSRNIKVLLTVHNLEREEFGNMIANSSPSAVTSWIKGVSTPPLDKLILICNQFDLKLDQLVFGEVGKSNPAYDEFVGKNHPDMFKEEKSAYRLKPGDVLLNDDVLKDPDKMGALVRWLTESHDRLKKDALYSLYTSRIIQEHENETRRTKLRNDLLKGKNP